MTVILVLEMAVSQNGVQVIVDDAIYERLTGKDTYSEFFAYTERGC